MNPSEIRVLIISGSMGSGKSTVLAEASDILTSRGIAHASIDLDALGCVHSVAPSSAQNLPPDSSMMYRNLKSVWENCAAAGVKSLLIARAVETKEELGHISAAIPGAKIVVCRLKAPLLTMQQRVRLREVGMLRQQFIRRVAELETRLNESGIEDFAIDNFGSPVTEVARQILERAKWL
jgi:hypothetical protein